MVNKWKVVAIIFIILFFLETGFIIYAINIALEEEKDINLCYYTICNDYQDAWYENGVCYCYENDILGNLQIGKTEYMKK